MLKYAVNAFIESVHIGFDGIDGGNDLLRRFAEAGFRNVGFRHMKLMLGKLAMCQGRECRRG